MIARIARSRIERISSCRCGIAARCTLGAEAEPQSPRYRPCPEVCTRVRDSVERTEHQSNRRSRGNLGSTRAVAL